MRSPAAQILETALALQRAPGERLRLRERPLPDGLVHVLEVASGSPHALASAAAELGESEPNLLEAARFYLEQVLFAAPDATAYRILGVPQDASPELIRTHHRWLQRWLHPDRAQAGDASVFATRVNQAWSTLRMPESRHQYDVKLAEARMAGASAPLPAATVRHWEHDDVGPTHGRRSRWLLGAALAACAVLAVLIVRHEQGPEPWSPGDAAAIPVADEAPLDQPALDDRDLGILTEALAISTAAAPVGAAEAAIAPPAPAPVAPPTTPTTAPPPQSPRPPHVGAAQAAPTPPAPIQIAARAAPTRESRAAAPVAMPPPTPIPVAVSAPPTREVPPSPHAEAAQAAPNPAQPPTVLLDRMHKAEQRVAQVAAFLVAQPGAAPLWNDVRTAQDAERIRNRLAASQGSALELATPNWQLQRDNATLSVNYRCGQCRVRQGRLDVELVWREGLWLVRGVGLAPSA